MLLRCKSVEPPMSQLGPTSAVSGFLRSHRLLGLIKRDRRAIVTNTFVNGHVVLHLRPVVDQADGFAFSKNSTEVAATLSC
jgi:hypothetical protein